MERERAHPMAAGESVHLRSFERLWPDEAEWLRVPNITDGNAQRVRKWQALRIADTVLIVKAVRPEASERGIN